MRCATVVRAMAEVDVVVVSYNSAEELPGCVAPLARAEGVNVVVVDSASTDDSVAVARALPVTVEALPDNRGFGYGCNAGARLGSAPYVLLLNPDARLDEASLRRMVDTANA